MVASTVEGVMAQRLVRRLCTNCKEIYVPTDDELPPDFPRDKLKEIGGKLYRSVGLPDLPQRRLCGRMGIYELLLTTNKIRQLAHDRASTWAITQAAVEEGMTTLRVDGWRKVLSGRTTVDEVARDHQGRYSLRPLTDSVVFHGPRPRFRG